MWHFPSRKGSDTLASWVTFISFDTQLIWAGSHCQWSQLSPTFLKRSASDISTLIQLLAFKEAEMTFFFFQKHTVFDILSGIQVNIFFAVNGCTVYDLSLHRVLKLSLKGCVSLAVIEHLSYSSCHWGVCDLSGLWLSYSSCEVGRKKEKQHSFPQATDGLCSPSTC